MLIYIHGFNSSARSGKARELGAWLARRGVAESYACPDLPDRPRAAIELLSDLIARGQGETKLIGSSLGGFYATWLAERFDLKTILINPCIACHDKLRDQVGVLQQNWHSGASYTFTQAHLDDLLKLRVARPTRPERYLLLAETGDAVLDYREAVAYYTGARQIVLEGGDHGFTRFAEYLPAILDF